MTGLQACRRAIVQALETRRLLCINHDPMGFGGYPVDPDWTPPVVSEEDSVASIDVLQVPAYHSRPTAPQSIYLDFNGSPAIPAWGAWGPYTYKSVTESHAFDNDGNNDAFSTQELADIREIWMGVSEKFSPWNINVTTVKPNPINGARVVIGGDGAWNGSGGGVALIGTWGEEGVFDRIASNVCFVWANQDDTDYVIEAVAHEVGHVIGLHHMSDYPPTPAGEYLPGFIMGSGFKTEVGRWGHALHPTRTSSGRDGDGNLVDHGQQDDLDDIFKNGEDEDYAPVADVVGATNATSQLIQLTTTNGVTQGSASGLIETSSDADWYRIVHPGGRLDIDVLSAQFRGMLDPVVEVRTTSTLLDTFDADGADDTDSNGLGEIITYNNLAAGTYYIAVRGTGDYGDMGQYRIRVSTAPTQTTFNNTMHTATKVGLFGGLDASSVERGFAGIGTVLDSLTTTDAVDFFKIRAPLYSKQFRFYLTNLSASATLAVYYDLDGNGQIGANETLYETANPTTNIQLFTHNETIGNRDYYVRVRKSDAATSVNYTLKIISDAAPSSAPLASAPQAFDPQPQLGSKFVYDAIDGTSDNTDYYRNIAKADGRFYFYLTEHGNNLRMAVGFDNNNNGVFDSGEIVGEVANTNLDIEKLENILVLAGQTLLIRIIGETFNTSTGNYTLEAIADYATGGNTNGSLAGARDLSDFDAHSLIDHVGNIPDTYDTIRISPSPGEFTARIDAIGTSAFHKLELIRDADADNVVDAGEILASANANTVLAYNLTQTNNIYLRVRTQLLGEFFSVGNYKLVYLSAGSVNASGFDSPTPVLFLPNIPGASATGYLGFDPETPELINDTDHFAFTLSQARRMTINSDDPEVGIQIGQKINNKFVRFAGLPRGEGLVNSLDVNLPAGSYMVRAYRQFGENSTEAVGQNYRLTFVQSTTIAAVRPVASNGKFEFDQYPTGVTVDFDQDVLGSIEPTDLVVENLSNGSFMSISELFYDSTTNKAAFVFSAGHLPDGRYRATLDNLAIRNSHADAMANDYSFDFHVLAGDANRDETVNFNDLLIVAQNYGQEDRRFSQGNVNYSLDGKVDFNDLLIIAQNYGVSVVQTASTRPTPFNYSHRIGEDVLSSDIGVRQASIRTCRFSQLAMPSDLVL